MHGRQMNGTKRFKADTFTNNIQTKRTSRMIARSFVFVIVLPHPRVGAWWKSLSPRPVILTLALGIIILTNYHSRSSVVREDESNRTLAKREEIRENKDAKALETQTHFKFLSCFELQAP